LSSRPNRFWVTDITHIPTAKGMLYLCAVVDLCGKMVLAYRVGNDMTASLVTDTIRGVIRTVKAGSVEVISPAKENDTPVSPKTPLYTGGAFLAGIVLAFVAALLIETFDNTFKSKEDIQKYLGLTVIGFIPSTEVKG
jgi:capsular polysaccharide biosynthesis protein